MQKIKNSGTKKFAKLPPAFDRRAVDFVARRRLAGVVAAGLFFKVVLRVRVAIFLQWSVVGGQI